MKKLTELLRIVVISPEMLILLIAGTIALYFPQAFIFIGEKFKTDEKLWEFIPVIPFAIFSFIVYLSFQLQAPVESANRELYDWELYWALKYRILVALVWAGLASLISLLIWFLSKTYTPAILGWLFISSISLSVIVAGTAILALFSLKENLSK